VRQVIAGFIGSLLIAGLIAPAVASAAAPTIGVAKVVVIVGPAGSATDRYRAEARLAADLARKYTPDVTEIYSPEATWPAVRRALQGASLVIYMGHGNGWPSPYRDELYPPTQNGFGLNPSAGSGDDTHQYFGESKIAASIRLAPDAVVLLNHLCYASGNSEPGLAEGTLAMAKRRVDNFAAGFVKAGASAVVAEAYANPNQMVRSILGGRGSIESAWRHAPSANGHSFGFESTRSAGYVVEMDPERSSSGFSRSIVLKAGLASADVLRGGRGSVRGSPPVDATVLVPSLATHGIALKTPAIAGGTAAGSRVYYRIPFTVADRSQLPDKVQASVRWDPLDPVVSDPSAMTGGTETTPDFGLIAPERVGDVVSPIGLTITRTRMSFHVATPATPGRYRLTVMLHDGDGVAYDAATQAMVSTLIVRVTGDLDAGVIAPSQIEATPGQAQRVSVWVANLGKAAWGRKPEPIKRSADGALRQTNLDDATHARLAGTWVALGGLDDPAQLAAAAAASVTPVELPAGMAPRSVTKVELTAFAPTAPGDYLLMLDILTPGVGSLSAQGVDPTIVRVHVGAASAASTSSAGSTSTASPDPGASATPAPSAAGTAAP
jgi:hypothetical protein